MNPASSSHFNLTPDEYAPIHVTTSSHDQTSYNPSSLNILGKLLTTKPYNLHALRNTLKLSWNLQNRFVMREIFSNLFAIQFACVDDKQKVLQQGPWSFDKHLLMLKEAGTTQPSAVAFDSEWFWLRVHDFPFDSLTLGTATAIGKLFFDFQMISETELQQSMGILHLKILMNVNIPIRRGALLVSGDNKQVWIQFQYERLPNFGYTCGKLGHIQADCIDSAASKFDKQYGPWLRVSPLSKVVSKAVSDLPLPDEATPNLKNNGIKQQGNRKLLDAILSCNFNSDVDLTTPMVDTPTDVHQLVDLVHNVAMYNDNSGQSLVMQSDLNVQKDDHSVKNLDNIPNVAAHSTNTSTTDSDTSLSPKPGTWKRRAKQAMQERGEQIFDKGKRQRQVNSVDNLPLPPSKKRILEAPLVPTTNIDDQVHHKISAEGLCPPSDRIQ